MEERKVIYAMFDAASLAIITPTDLDSITRKMPHHIAAEFRTAWQSALAKFEPAEYQTELATLAIERESR